MPLGTADDSAAIASQSPAQGTIATANGSIAGTVTDENGDLIPGATVILQGSTPGSSHTLVADDNALFAIQNLAPGIDYRVNVHVTGFVDWTSEPLHLDPGQHLVLKNVILKVDGGPITVTVSASQDGIAAEQVRIAEKQRVFGIIPNFLVAYDHNSAPLTPKLFGDEVRAGLITHPLDISDVWKNRYSTSTNHKVWAAKFTARHPNLVALEGSSFKCGHDAPIYGVIEGIIEESGTPYFSFKDLDENKPTGSIRIRVETIDYFLRRYREDIVERKRKELDIEARMTEFERNLRVTEEREQPAYAAD